MIIPREIVEKFEKLLEDNEEITFQNDYIPAKEMREAEKFLSPEYTKTRKSVVVFWDDVLQFTTLGLIDCLMDHFNLGDDVRFDLSNFFYRGVENTRYNVFVKRVFKTLFNKQLTDEFIMEFEKKYYGYILQRSPVAALYDTFIKMYLLHGRIFICFRHPFDGCRELCQSLLAQIPIPTGMSIEYGFLSEYENDELKFLKDRGNEFDVIMIQDLSKAFNYLDITNNTRNRVLMAPNIHNGVHEDYFATLYETFRNIRVGPYNSTLAIHNDSLFVL